MVDKKKPSSSKLMLFLKFRTFIALIVLFVFFALTTPNFMSFQSLILIAKHVALYGLLAIGMTFVIITGGIDLSVGSVTGLVCMLAGLLIKTGLPLEFLGIRIFFSVPVIVIISLLAGVIIGVINGLVVTKLNVAPFIATLGGLYICRGFAMLSNGGATFPNLVGDPELGNTGFGFFGSGTFFGIPVAIYILIIFGVVAAFILKKLPLGWHIFSVGGNEKASKLSGVKVDNVKIFVYMFSGLCAAMVGLITASQLMASHPATGETWEMNAIAAAVLGGTSMSCGIGTIGGTVIGAFVIGVLNDGMVMQGISEFWQMVIKGLVIVIAVVIDQFQRKLQNRLALEQR